MADELNWRQRKRVFLAALEILEVSRHATACGMSRKLNELAEFVDKGGKVGKGALFVTAARGSNHSWLDWAVDFLGCLPKEEKEKVKVLAVYAEDESSRSHDSWAQRKFWATVGARGLESDGLLIARKMA